MQRSTRIRFTTALVALASLTFIAATSTAAFDPLESIPTGAVAVMTTGDPSGLFLNVAGFLRNAGLEEPAAGLEGFMSSLTAPGEVEKIPESARLLIRAFDLNRRVVAAVYPGSDGSGRPAALLFIPLRSALSAEERSGLAAAVEDLPGSGEGPGSVSMDYPGYVVVHTGGSEIPAYGSGSTMNLGRLGAYPASSVAVWADPNAGAAYLDLLPGGLGSLVPGLDDGYQDDEYYYEDLPLDTDNEAFVDNESPLHNESPLDNESSLENEDWVDNEVPLDNEAVADDEAAIDDEPEYEYAEDFSWDEDMDFEEAEPEPFAGPRTGQFDRVGATLKKGMEELAGIEFAVVVQKDRAWVRAGVELKSGGSLAPLASRAAAGDATLPYLSYCDANALVSVAWSAPNDWSLPLMEALYSLVMPDHDLADAAMASMKAYAAAAGMNGGMSFGIEPSEELMRAFRAGIRGEDEALMSMIERGLGLRVSGALELIDRQAFRDASAKSVDFAKDPAYTELLASSGFSMDIDRTVGVVDGMPYDSYTYSFAAQGDSGDRTGAVAELLGRLISPVYFYHEDKAFLGLGPIKEAAAAIPKAGARQPLRTDRTFKALRAGAPADARALMYVSTKALSRLVLRARPEGQAALGYNAGKLSGVLTWFDASPTSAGFGFGIGSEDIKAMIALFD